MVEAFDETPRPNFDSIHSLGCCDEHEQDFAWYRNHNWREFKQELSSGQFDAFQFNSLHPLAYHYFVPGILLAILDSIEADEDQRWPLDWIGQLTPLKSNTEQFIQNYLPKFTADQKKAVADFLVTINDWLVKIRGWPDADVERAITQVWLAVNTC